MTIRGVTTAVFVCAAMAGVARAQSGDVPITIVVSDYAADVAPALQVQSDGNGFYRNSKTLTAVIQPGGDWVLDSLNPAKSTRAIYLRFTQPVPGSGPGGSAPLPLPSGLYKARIISACSSYGNSMWAVSVGTTVTCPLHVRFDASGGSYALQMNPATSLTGSYPETNPAEVTCLAAAAGSTRCSQWRVAPSASSPEGTGKRNVAKLLKYSSSKGQTIAEDKGDYYVSFLILLSNP